MALPTNATALALLCAAALWAGGCASQPAVTPGAPAGPQPIAAPAPPAPPAASAAETPPGAPAAPAEAPVEIAEPLAELPTEEVVDELAAAEVAADDSESAALLQQSLAAFEEAQALFEAGESDFALAALDRAYELLARVQANGDALAAQEKENLRLLIARRLVEIHAARRRLVGDAERSIPRVVNAEVEREIRSFQGPERAFFLDAYRRSGRYRPMIGRAAAGGGAARGSPWLPLVESGFKDRALSSARALALAVHRLDRLPLRARAQRVGRRADGSVEGDRGAIGYPATCTRCSATGSPRSPPTTAASRTCCARSGGSRRATSTSSGTSTSGCRARRGLRAALPRHPGDRRGPGKYARAPRAGAAARLRDGRDRALDAARRHRAPASGSRPGRCRSSTPSCAAPRRRAVPTLLRVPPEMVPLLASLESLPAYTPPPRVEQATHRVRSGDALLDRGPLRHRAWSRWCG